MVDNSRLTFTEPSTYLKWSVINLVFFSLGPITAVLIGAAFVFSHLTQVANSKQDNIESRRYSHLAKKFNQIATIIGLLQYAVIFFIALIFYLHLIGTLNLYFNKAKI